jgi:GxxExxY protein
LRKTGFHVGQQSPIKVRDQDGTVIGDYFTDLLVEGSVLIELKAAKALAPEHEAQVLGYLKATRLQHGLLINFGSYKFQMRKFIWSERLGARQEPSRFSPVFYAFFAFCAAIQVARAS